MAGPAHLQAPCAPPPGTPKAPQKHPTPLGNRWSLGSASPGAAGTAASPPGADRHTDTADTPRLLFVVRAPRAPPCPRGRGNAARHAHGTPTTQARHAARGSWPASPSLEPRERHRAFPPSPQKRNQPSAAQLGKRQQRCQGAQTPHPIAHGAELAFKAIRAQPVQSLPGQGTSPRSPPCPDRARVAQAGKVLLPLCSLARRRSPPLAGPRGAGKPRVGEGALLAASTLSSVPQVQQLAQHPAPGPGSKDRGQ